MTSTRAPFEGPLPDLSTLGREAFSDIVDAEIRDAAPHGYAEALRHPDNLERWYTALVSIKVSIESQLGARQSDMVRRLHETAARNGDVLDSATDKVAYHKWRASILRVKGGAERRLLEARLLRDQQLSSQAPSLIEQERNRYGHTVDLLTAGITEHWKQVHDDDLEPTQYDIALWALIGLKPKPSTTQAR